MLSIVTDSVISRQQRNPLVCIHAFYSCIFFEIWTSEMCFSLLSKIFHSIFPNQIGTVPFFPHVSFMLSGFLTGLCNACNFIKLVLKLVPVYIYIYIYVCVCVCVCVRWLLIWLVLPAIIVRERERERRVLYWESIVSISAGAGFWPFVTQTDGSLPTLQYQHFKVKHEIIIIGLSFFTRDLNVRGRISN
jgi:hypothetical protein